MSLRSLNKVLLVGNLTRDPKLKYSQAGTAIGKLGLAVNHNYKDKSGEWQNDACFIDITVFGKMAENCNEYLKKGRSVYIEGRLSFSSWETKDGQKRSKHEVVAERVQFLRIMQKKPSA